MASTTSLLKSAAATRKKIRQQEDDLKAFLWESSAKTRADFEEYMDYLDSRLEGVTDPGEQLSYMTKQRTIRRSFVSEELQREQMNIMQGTGTTQTKMQAIERLYQEAVDNEDYNLAQNLVSQWMSLSIQSQNEARVAGERWAAASYKEKTKFISKLKKGVDNITLPDGSEVSPISVIEKGFRETGDVVAAAKAARDTLRALGAAIVDQYNSATTQEEIDRLEEQYGKNLDELAEGLYITIGGQKLAYIDVENAIANDEFNNPLYGLQAEYNEATGKTEFKLTKNNVEAIDYIRRINEQGQEEYVPSQIRTSRNDVFFGTTGVERGLGARLTNEGGVADQKDESQMTIGDRLAALGIDARAQDNSTTIIITLPGENVERLATIQPDGSIRYYDDNGQINEIGLIDRNLGTNDMPLLSRAGEARIVSLEELSDFGTRGVGGQLSTPSLQGQRYISDILGKTRAPAVLNLNTPIRVGNDFSGFGTGVTTSLLQNAGQVQRAIQLQAQQQQMMQQAAQLQGGASLQSGVLPNLNQAPVQQLTSSGVLKGQLKVSLPTPQPRLVVSQPQAQPNLRVSAPTPQPQIRLSQPAPAPRLVVR